MQHQGIIPHMFNIVHKNNSQQSAEAGTGLLTGPLSSNTSVVAVTCQFICPTFLLAWGETGQIGLSNSR